MFLKTFPIVVCVRVFASIVSVFDIYRRNVCTTGIKMKSQHAKHAKVKKSENSFVRVG